MPCDAILPHCLLRIADVGFIDRSDRGGTGLAHGEGEFVAKDFEYFGDAGFSVGTEGPEIRAADGDGCCAEGQGFEDVGTSAETAVDEDGDFVVDSGDYFREGVERATGRIDGAAAVVGYDDAVDTIFYGELCVFAGFEALEDKLHFGEFSIFFERFPGLGRVMDGEVFGLEALEHRHGTAAFFTFFCDWVTGRALAGIKRVGAGFGFSVATALGIDRDDECGAADSFCASDHALCIIPNVGWIELIPEGALVDFGDVFDGGGSDSREDLEMA